jgi:CspA family cold shock protein
VVPHSDKVGRSAIVVGTVKSFGRQQGQGFIAVDGGQDIFVHFQAVQNSGLSNLRPGQSVGYAVPRNSANRLCATPLVCWMSPPMPRPAGIAWMTSTPLVPPTPGFHDSGTPVAGLSAATC